MKLLKHVQGLFSNWNMKKTLRPPFDRKRISEGVKSAWEARVDILRKMRNVTMLERKKKGDKEVFSDSNRNAESVCTRRLWLWNIVKMQLWMAFPFDKKNK